MAATDLVTLLATCLYTFMVLYVFLRRPRAPLWPGVLWAQLAGLAFCVGELGTQLSTREPTYLVWLTIEYLGIYFLPLAWWELSQLFSESLELRQRNRRRIRAAIAVSFLFWLALATNPIHGLYITPRIGERNLYSPFWWAGTTWCYLLLIFTLVRYLRLVPKVEKRVRSHIGFLVFASALPLFGNFYYIVIDRDTTFDPTITALALTGVFLLVGIEKMGLFELRPLGLENIIEHDRDGVILAKREGKILYCNRSARRLLNAQDLLVGGNLFETLRTSLRDRDGSSDNVATPDFQSLSDVEPRSPFRLAGHAARWVEVQIETVASERFDELLKCRLRETTELEQAREQAELSTAMMESLLGSATEGLAVTDSSGHPLYANDVFHQLIGNKSPNDPLLIQALRLVENRSELISVLRQTRLEPLSTVEVEVQLNDHRTLMVRSHPISTSGGPAGRVWSVVDVSVARQRDRIVRRRSERLTLQNAALVKLAKRIGRFDEATEAYATIVQAASEVLAIDRVSIWIFDEDGAWLRRIAAVGPSDHEREIVQIRSSDVSRYVATLTKDRVISAPNVFENPDIRELAESYLKPLGIVSLLDAPVRLAGELRGVVCHETTTEKRDWHADELAFAASIADMVAMLIEKEQTRLAQRALRESEIRYRELVENAPIGILAYDTQGKLITANRHVANIFGEDWIAARRRGTSSTSEGSDIQGEIRTALESGKRSEQELEVSLSSEREMELRLHVVPLKEGHSIAGVLALVEDITEIKRNETALLHSQKLESIGVLAGGIAHDFNNLLVGVLGNASLLLELLPEDFSYREHLESIEKAGRGASDLTQRLLAYAGRGQYIATRFDLRDLAMDTDKLLELSIGTDVSVELDLGEAPTMVEADRAQLRQVLLNLVSNASDAIGDRPGRIQIRLTSANLSKDLPETTFGELSPGPHVLLEVRDDGCGMESEVKDRIFDPFFTTKFTGRGLGMAAVLGIVKGHQGAMAIESEPGKGTRFQVYFRAAPPGPEEKLEAPFRHRKAGSLRVLVADDDPLVLDVTQRILQAADIEGVPAQDGSEALRIFREQGESIDVVLLDITMPRMNGVEAMSAIREIDCNVPVVLTSGHAEEEIRELANQHTFDHFVQKPFKVDQLVAALREAAHRRRSVEKADHRK